MDIGDGDDEKIPLKSLRSGHWGEYEIVGYETDSWEKTTKTT